MDLNTVKSIYRSTADYANKEVTLGGWIRTMRVSKNVFSRNHLLLYHTSLRIQFILSGDNNREVKK